MVWQTMMASLHALAKYEDPVIPIEPMGEGHPCTRLRDGA